MPSPTLDTLSPPPLRLSRWWASQPLDWCAPPTFMATGQWLGAALTSHSVVLGSTVEGTGQRALFQDPIIFPTWSDALLWLRWVALPISEREHQLTDDDLDKLRGFCGLQVTLTGERRAVAEVMAAAPPEAEASAVMATVLDRSRLLGLSRPEGKLEWNVGGHVLGEFITIHELLDRLVTRAARRGFDGTAHWRKAAGLNDQRVSRVGGRWFMPDELWAKLGARLGCGQPLL